MALVLELVKEEVAQPIVFAMSKNNKFIVDLYWESKHDLDVHAIALGADGKYKDVQDILSTYNPHLVKVANPAIKHVSGNSEAFQNIEGSLIHTGDSRNGLSTEPTPDETLEVIPPNLRAGRQQVAFFITNHPPATATFKDVNGARIVIKDEDGTELLQANLTRDFDAYGVVQIGAIQQDPDTLEWSFLPVAAGFAGKTGDHDGTFNDVLARKG